jgi:hypothetical protein
MDNDILPLGARDDGEWAAPPIAPLELGRFARAEREGWPKSNLWVSARKAIDSLLDWLRLERHGEISQLTNAQKANAADPAVGWGVAYASGVSAAVRVEVERLRQYRQGRALPDWKDGTTLQQWLLLLGITPQNRDTEKLPYYVLLVGTPAQISFEAQYELDRLRAVGRLDLGDDAAAYRAYVDTLIAHETARLTARSATLIATRNGGDQATALSANHLIPKLYDELQANANGYALQKHDGLNQATLKAALRPANGDPSPALFFLASHGLTRAAGHAELLATQGAWIGSEWHKGLPNPSPASVSLTGAQVGADFCAPGSAIFALACFGAGTTPASDYARYYNKLYPQRPPLPEQNAAQPFTAALPQRLLGARVSGQPASALAYVGHVDLSWSDSFWDAAKGRADLTLWSEFSRRLLTGQTVGMALDRLADRVNDDNQAIATALESRAISDETHLLTTAGKAWISRNNTRGFILLGDPAVRLEQVLKE